MHRKREAALALMATALVAAAALAHAGGTTETTAGDGSALAGTHPTQVEAQSSASTHAEATTNDRRQALETRAAKVSARTKAQAETKLEAAAKSVQDQARQGEPQVASRLAAEFGTTSQAMMDEKNQLQTSWGNLMIAHTLASNASTGMTVPQLIEMKDSGMGWGQIAAGLGLNLGSVVSAVKAETRVANGLSKADGHVAAIHGEGARGGVDADAHAGLDAKHDKLGLGAGAGVGLHIGH